MVVCGTLLIGSVCLDQASFYLGGKIHVRERMEIFSKMGKKVLKKIKKLGCGIRTNLKSSVPNLRFAPHGRI
jgi:hypothetical protein